MSYTSELTFEIDNFLRDAVPDETTDEYYRLLRQACQKLKGLDEMILELEYDNKQKYDGINDLRKQIDRYQRVLRVAMES